jgi:hypothetical protein
MSAYNTFMAYNPIGLIYALSLKMHENNARGTCPIPFWGTFSFLFLQALSVPMFFMRLIFAKDLERRGQDNLLYELGEMDESEQIEAIWKLCLERNIPHFFDSKEEEEIVASERGKC